MPTKHQYKHRGVQLLAVIGLGVMLLGIFIGGRQPGAGNLFNPPWEQTETGFEKTPLQTIF